MHHRSTLSLCILIPVWAIQACSGDVSIAPPVPDSTLVDVLSDLHLSGARMEPDSTHIVRDSILAHWAISPEDFEATLSYYVEHPEAYVLIYDRVLDRLSAHRPIVFTIPDSVTQE
jgi:hypothetical protein